MASWQSKILNLALRVQVKRRLGKAKDAATVRKIFEAPMPAVKGPSYAAASVGGIAGEWVQAGGEVLGTVLYLHGGGYLACSPRTHRPITASFANRGLKVFAADYRLAPETPFPGAVDDGLAAYKGLLELGVAPARLAVSGDSAGGGLVLAVLLAAKAAGLPMPACAMVFSPWTDLAITGETVKSNLKRDAMLHGAVLADGAAFYLNGADAKNPLASPLYGDLAGLPALYVAVGEAEVLRDDSVRFAERARAAGVEVSLKIWDGMPHVWQLFQFLLPEARAGMAEAADFAKAHFSG